MIDDTQMDPMQDGEEEAPAAPAEETVPAEADDEAAA